MASAGSPLRPTAPRSIASVRSTDSSKKTGQPLSLAKRLLFPNLPSGSDLPPLLASPDLPKELDAELYDFVALALRAFVNPWWSKISRYDKDFLPEIDRILTVVLRAFETRLRAADLAPLVLCDIPILVEQHYVDYRNAASKLHTSYAAGGAASLPQLFHQLQPHMAVSFDGQINPDYMRQVVDHILLSCLPPDDYQSEPERFIVREIVLKIILNSVIPKITQGWFIHKAILDALGGPPSPAKPGDNNYTDSSSHRKLGPPVSFQTLVVFFLSAIQRISSLGLLLIHGYRQLIHLTKLVNEHHGNTTSKHAETAILPPPPLPLSPPPPLSPESRKVSSMGSMDSRAPSDSPPSSQPGSAGPPHYASALLIVGSTILDAESRLASSSIFRALAILLAAGAPFLDKLLPYLLHTYVFSADMLVKIVVIGKRTLFPDGWPAPPPVDPTPEEQITIRENLIQRITEKIPGPAAQFILGPTEDARREAIVALIDPLSSRECNTHLVMFILDLVILTIFPEMGVSVP